MTSKVSTEFAAICGTTRIFGAAYTPRHQGPVEASHLTMSTYLLILLNEVCKGYPQEWAAMVPALEYLMGTQPRGPHGLSAFDLTQGYALVSDVSRQLNPFRVLTGQAETEVAQKLFDGLGSYMAYFRGVQ